MNTLTGQTVGRVIDQVPKHVDVVGLGARGTAHLHAGYHMREPRVLRMGNVDEAIEDGALQFGPVLLRVLLVSEDDVVVRAYNDDW